MNPSFHNKSSSDEISETDAFVQISKEDNLVGGNKSFELVEPSSCSQLKDEVQRTNMDKWTDLSCKIPTDQVPALKETTDSTELEGCSGIANLAAVGNNICAQTLVHAAANELYSKEEDSMQSHQSHHNLQHSTQVWPLVPKAASSRHDNQNCACESQDSPPASCSSGSVMSCQCLQFQNHLKAKGEAGSSKISPGQHLQQPISREVLFGGVVRGAGAGPNLPEPNDHHRHHLTVSEVDSSFSESVISSSISAAVNDVNFPPSPPTSSSPTTPPSLCGSSGTNIGSTCSAEQTSNANLVIHHGSSCSESLLHAQFQSETHGALSTQASENPVNSSEVQNQETIMQPSVISSLGNREGNCSSSSNICINLKGPQITSNVKQIGAHSDIPISAAVAGRQYYPKNEGIIKSSFIKLRCGGLPKQLSKSSYPRGPASNEGWGIPSGLGLLGGGESSLNSGTAGWGTPPSSNPNNNSGWGQNSSQNPAQSQWGGGSVNRNGGGASQGPAGQQNAGNSNKGNQQTHQQSHNQGGGPQQQQSGQSSTSVSSRDNQGQQGGGQNNTQQQQGNNGPTSQSSQNQQQQNGSTSWAQAAGKGLPGGQSTQGSGGGGGGGSGGNGGPNGGSTSNSTTKQLEQLNSMREALFSQDGWGGQHVNQDTGWDIPASPEPGAKDSGAVWKPNVNNGTDLWEANLRNGGQPPPQQAQKTPWGHTPATNIGGTWGEDDDVGDSSNVWTGVPSSGGGAGAGGPGMGNTGGPGGGGPGPGGAGAGGQWSSNSGGGGTMWGAKKEPEWGAAGSNWGDSRDSRELRGGDPRDIRGGDPRDMRDIRELRDGNIRGGGDHRGPVDNRGVDPRDLRDLRDPLMRDMRDIRDLPRELRGTGTAGDPCMGRMNGSDLGGGGPAAALAAAAMWGQQKGVGAAGGGVVGGPSQWAGPPPPQAKDMKPTGWEEPSPPTQRRNIPNYDDGTSLWGNPTQQPGKGETRKVSHWKEMPTPNMGRGGMQCPPGISQNRLPSGGSGGMKGDAGGPQWGHPSRNRSWGDTPHDTGNSGWGDDPKVAMGGGGVNSWNEPQLNPSWGGQKPKPAMNPAGWVEDNMDASSWSHKQNQGPKPLTKEVLWASKQFRILSEIGFKKEDVENALRSTNMNLEDAHDLLNAGRVNLDAWRRHEDHSPFDLTAASHPVAVAAAAAAVFPGQRFNTVTQPMPFAPPGPGVGNPPSLLNTLNNANPSLASINNISPAMVQKILSQQPPPQQPPTQQPTPFQPTPRAPQNQPSAAQLRMLVQQIQMAVQAGYLNHQILNQPLAPQTLILLNQLLQQIKILQQQQLMQSQTIIQGKGSSNSVLQISVQITKTKQQITNLQNQIAAQQAIYVKQQQQQQHHLAATQGGGGPQSGGDYFKPPMHDPMAALHGNFGELTINDPKVQATYQNQSRLNQWKLPSLDKDGDVGAGSEFSRAPGTTSKSTLPQPNSSPNINPLLGQGDGTWSTVSRSSSDTGWPETSNSQSGDVTGAQSDKQDSQWPTSVAPATSAAFTDLVPEFEPGKPWKGTQMKSIEDDPTITPGSVVRSPLSLPTIKDTEIFGGGGSVVGGGGNKSSMPVVSSSMEAPIPPLSLSSSTWSFNPTSTAAPSSSFTSPLGSKLGGVKSSWGDAPPPTPVTSELWGAPAGKSRGPPPGLSSKAASNGWGILGSGSGGNSAVRSSGSSSSWGIQGAPWGSTWLLLRNLTPQIDGSTLKTLCVQHGPLQSFHLYLNHELALAKYSTREEAAKAQGALNNCVLGNTTIFAESPAESEVHTLLQHLGHGAQQQQAQGGSSTGWGIRGAGAPPVVAQNSQAHFAPVVPNSQAGQQQSKQAADAWGGGGGSQLWPSTPASSLWGAPPLDGGNDQHRATPSSLQSYLPGDLLGGEPM